MDSNCTNRSPYQHPGTDSQMRMPDMLRPENLLVDDRGEAELLLFLERISKHLVYYNEGNLPDGSWKTFLEKDISVVLAGVAEQSRERHRGYLQYLFRELKNPENKSRPAYLKKGLTQIYGYSFGIIKHINLLWEELPDTVPMKQDIRHLIQNRITGNFGNLIAWYKAAGTDHENLLDFNLPHDDLIAPVELVPNPKDLVLNPIWFSGFDNYNDYFDGIPADDKPYSGFESTVFGRIYALLTYNLFTSVISNLQGKFFNVINHSREAFRLTINEWPDHQAHMGLLIGFLKLCFPARSAINELTYRHLDFYYQDILGLKPASHRPDTAFVKIEPVRNAGSVIIPADTHFDGGKDESGTKRVYINKNDVVVNEADVRFTASVMRDGNTIKAIDELTPPDERETHGNKGWIAAGNDSMPLSRIGFAMGSQALFMEQGDRTLMVVVFTKPGGSIHPGVTKDHFKASISGQKGWIDLLPTQYQGFPEGFYFIFEIGADQDPVVVPDPEIHEENFETSYPILKVELNQLAAGFNINHFESVIFENIWLGIDVKGLRNLVIQNPDGGVDPSKDFFAFGSQPKKGNDLIIGSEEAFSKYTFGINLNFEWESLEADHSNAKVDVSYLKKGKWESVSGAIPANMLQPVGGAGSLTTKLFLPGDQVPSISGQPAFNPLTTTSHAGFLRLKIDRDFDHSTFQARLIKAAIAMSNDPENDSLTLPSAPFTPKLKSLEMNYYALAKTGGEDQSNLVLYHLGPFGNSVNYADNLMNINENHGVLYLGFEKISPGESVQVLFMLEEGSANPTKLPANVNYKYLSGSSWKEFPRGFLIDNTLGLLRSEIIRISFPLDAISDNNVFQGPELWFAAEIEGDPDSICRIEAIQPGSISLEFNDQDNSKEHLEKGLEQGTISKMIKPVSQVKKISQVFPSINGQPSESHEEFILSVSERLRNKDRAIQAWDYEHLLLHHFPQLHHIRTLNHTKSIMASAHAPWQYNELAAGHATLVLVADQRKVYQPDPLKPYVPLSVIAEINEFLKSRVSDHTTYYVINPVFEEIRLNFKVAFREGITDTEFYIKRLNESVIQYLSPWAFNLDARPGFGNVWHKSQLITFIENQEYVDYISCFQMDVVQHDGELNENLLEARGTTGASILVSAPLHNIMPDENCNC